MSKPRVSWLVVPVVLTTLVAVGPGAVSAAPLAGPVAASGTYDTPNPVPPVVSVDPDDPTTKFHAEISKGTNFFGTFTGSTQYNGSGTYDPATGSSEGNLVEVFTGVVAGVGTGTVTFAEHFTSDPAPDGLGLTLLDADITSATGELTGLTGHLHFEGESDVNSVGTGTYTGWIDASQVVPDSTTTTPTTTAAPTTTPSDPAPAAVVRPAYTG